MKLVGRRKKDAGNWLFNFTVLITHALTISDCLSGEVTIKQLIPNTITSDTVF